MEIVQWPSLFYLFFNDTAPTEIYTLSLHDALPISGEGQLLTVVGAGGAKGMQLRISGDEARTYGNVKFIEGIGESAVNLVTSIVGPDGTLDTKTSSLTRDLERIQEERVRLDDRIASYQERLVSQFTAADSLIARLSNTGDYLTQQLAALAPQNFNKK